MSLTAHYDLVVIGGGIHGVGCAQAGAARGWRTLLLEQEALAAGTSSRSSKLIHGGLRYLESAQLRLVRESLRERAILIRIAPQLVKYVAFHIPVYREMRRRPWEIRAGLSLYALLGNLGPEARFQSLPAAAWDDLDGLRTSGLRAVYRYYDGQTDDAALTRAVMRSAQELGAELVCPGQFRAAQRLTDSYLVRFQHQGRELECRADAVINAAGPWVNQVIDKVSPPPAQLDIELVQGSHILVNGLARKGIYYVEAPADQRAVFVMPWRDATLIGTTETPHHAAPEQVAVQNSEIDYLMRTLRHYFPRWDVQLQDSFAGLRVLPRQSVSAFHRPRETIFMLDEPNAPRWLSIYGGKLTGYRATAQKVLDRLAAQLPRRRLLADTANLPLVAD